MSSSDYGFADGNNRPNRHFAFGCRLLRLRQCEAHHIIVQAHPHTTLPQRGTARLARLPALDIYT
jgi:hypothetical protein